MIGIVGTRFAAALGLLLLLVFLQLVAPSAFPILVAAVLVVSPFLNLAAYWFFARRAVLPDAPFTLKIRVQDALALLLASTTSAVLGVLVVLRALNVIAPVDRAIFLVGIAFALLMLAAPAVNWLVVWRPWRQP